MVNARSIRAGNLSLPLGQGQLPSNLPPQLPPPLPPQLPPQVPTMFPLVDHAEGGDENQPHTSAHNSTSTANQDVVAAQLAAMQQQFGVFQVVLAQLLARNNPGDLLIHLLNPAPQPPTPQQNPEPVQHAPALSESQGQSHIAPAQQPLPDDVTRCLDSLEKLLAEQRGAPPTHHAVDSIPHPLNTNITLEPYLAGFKIPQLKTYNGTKDPDDHLHAFYSCILPPMSISSYTEMTSAFATKFSSGRLIKKTTSKLMQVKQRDGESLKNYMSRFNDAVLEVSSFDQAVGIAANPTPSKNQNPEWRDDNPSRKRMRMAQNRGSMPTSTPRFGRSNSTPPQQSAGKPPVNCTPFNLPRSQIFMQIKNKMDLRHPGPMRTVAVNRDHTRYCDFHQDHGHTTEQCNSLREQRPQPQGVRNPPNRQGVGYQQAPPPLPPPIRIIHMITRGLEVGGLSSKQRKLYVREVKHQNRVQKRKFDDVDWKNQPITFTSADFDTIVTPHNDPLVTYVMINNCGVQRVLVDTGSAPDNIGRTYVTPSVRFLVVKMVSSFNIVIGRPTLTEIQAVVSQSHLCMKFPTPIGIATLRGNQKVARHCYITSVTQPKKGKDQTLEAIPQWILDNQQVMGVEIVDNQPEDEIRAAPVEDVEEVLIDDRDSSRKTQIGTRLNLEERVELIAFLQANNDIFAWTSADMPGIPNLVSQHELSTNPSKKPVAQKRRLFGGERLQAINEEVEKLLQAGFVRKVDYCEWVANPVLVKKANGKWRMCIDYTNLNQACPKDCNPMLSIDKLVEAASGNERLSLLDAYSTYHQVPMAPKDEEKTSFYVGDEIYYYVMMPFNLKNAGATYQKMVAIVFRAQIGRNLEVYVNDIVVKSLKVEDHLADLDETFNNLKKNRMRLNPAKCIFGMESGKFLASSSKGSRAGGLLIGPDGYRSEHALKFNFDATNNMAEYEALLLGLQLALELKINVIQVYSDSQLVVNQINSICEVVDPVMVKYVALVVELKCKFQKFCLSKISRIENEQADSLSKFVFHSSLSSKSVFVEVLDESSFMKPRMMEINIDLDTPKELTNLIAPWPFAQWGLDLLGPFVKEVGGVTHPIVGVDYFTKWVEAQPLSSLTSKKVEDFVFSSIIYRYGIPNQIVADNGTQFNCTSFRDSFRDFCSSYRIKLQFTSIYHPESNGMVESVNKCILEGIKPRLEQHKAKWADELNNVLWAYRTTSRTAIGETPYHLAFGTEAVIPIEIGVLSFRVTHFDEGRNGQLLWENLDLLAEVREEARLRTLVYKQRLANFYNKRVHPRTFKVGDLVLKKAGLTGFETRFGKLAPNWEGLYTVAEVPHPGAYILQDAKGKRVPRVWNFNNLKKFYP
ncbi:hypothetical protein SLEP1_g15146 [Rubroshorea leprosula]|uniref:Uncharacterized protein n=1 Tax=Rubroshorea leprosula TaxID=152421 RepID=A0AAV5ILG0_9ROSI|nr:hypothetical protein SLEP1_g15146 [Rubroshorea leprosula]